MSAQGLPDEVAGFIKSKLCFVSFVSGDQLYRCNRNTWGLVYSRRGGGQEKEEECAKRKMG